MLPSLVIAPRLSPVVHFSKEDVVSVDFIFAPYGPCLNIQNVSKNEIFRYMGQSQCDPLSETIATSTRRAFHQDYLGNAMARNVMMYNSV
jgi:hypothetical protein